MKLEILREIIKVKNDTPIDIINTYLYKKNLILFQMRILLIE